MKKVITDKFTFGKYVNAGMWKPIGNPQLIKPGLAAALVQAEVQLKPRKNQPIEYIKAEIKIEDYFTKNQIAKR